MSRPFHVGRFRALFLTGTAHCGSTLLGRMLGMHSEVLCVGEIMRLEDALALGYGCSCGASFDACPFWGPRMELLAPYRNDYKSYDLALFDELAVGARQSLVFDTSKTRVWRSRRNWSTPDARRRAGFVFLLRDSRGVLAAAKREGNELAHAAPRHVKWIKRVARLAEKEDGRTLVMTYEDLCRDPAKELRRLMGFLELPWEDALLRPADVVHHLIHASVSGYLAGSNLLNRDERWRSELTRDERRIVEEQMRRLPLLAELYLDEGSSRYVYRDAPLSTRSGSPGPR